MIKLKRQKMISRTLYMVFICVFSVLANAQSYDNRQGATQIEVKTNNVKNLLSSTSNSDARLSVGSVKNSELNSTLLHVDVKRVENSSENASDSSAETNVGAVKNTKAGNVDIKVRAKEVKTKVRGSNNHAKTNVGVLEDTSISGNATIAVKAGEITNTIAGGNNNEAEVSIGYDPTRTARNYDRQARIKIWSINPEYMQQKDCVPMVAMSRSPKNPCPPGYYPSIRTGPKKKKQKCLNFPYCRD